MSFFLTPCPTHVWNVNSFNTFHTKEIVRVNQDEEQEEEEDHHDDHEDHEDHEDHDDHDDQEDIGDVIDVTLPLWTMIEQVGCHLSFEQIHHMGMVQIIQQFLDTETSYRIYVAEHDKWLEYSEIHDLLRGLHNYYQFHLPGTDKTQCLERAFETISFHLQVEQQIQNVLMEFEML